MTVQALIDQLQKVANKEERVYFVDENYPMSCVDNHKEINVVLEISDLSNFADKRVILVEG